MPRCRGPGAPPLSDCRKRRRTPGFYRGRGRGPSIFRWHPLLLIYRIVGKPIPKTPEAPGGSTHAALPPLVPERRRTLEGRALRCRVRGGPRPGSRRGRGPLGRRRSNSGQPGRDQDRQQREPAGSRPGRPGGLRAGLPGRLPLPHERPAVHGGPARDDRPPPLGAARERHPGRRILGGPAHRGPPLRLVLPPPGHGVPVVRAPERMAEQLGLPVRRVPVDRRTAASTSTAWPRPRAGPGSSSSATPTIRPGASTPRRRWPTSWPASAASRRTRRS